jgi:hypothetical protein
VRTATALKYIWASPASAVGAAAALATLLIGSTTRMNSGVLEVSLRPRTSALARRIARLRFSAITFGHVVLASSEAEQDSLRPHERAHVRQYEIWGPLFLLAYPAESLVQCLMGGHPYRDNRFEVSARATAAQHCLPGAASGA